MTENDEISCNSYNDKVITKVVDKVLDYKNILKKISKTQKNLNDIIKSLIEEDTSLFSEIEGFLKDLKNLNEGLESIETSVSQRLEDIILSSGIEESLRRLIKL